MKRKILTVLMSFFGLHLFSNQFSEVISYSIDEWKESLVFEPFSYFIAIISFIVSFLAFSKIIFVLLKPIINRETKHEKIFYAIFITLTILVYRFSAVLVLIFAIGYAIMESIEYSKRVQRYSRREKN
ncbi:hypothetical protein [Evansella tamaricis]|uniref:Uncharacterized protein n=1 Tax=Evansella tamaricis TaxID=2069301 RepID=A0ABS6JKT1_9BACI|nr:hypothetical protein [Evansella tamaricis]MBU9714268.1 hypothetical protein [Evansella tamaricis]